MTPPATGRAKYGRNMVISNPGEIVKNPRIAKGTAPENDAEDEKEGQKAGKKGDFPPGLRPQTARDKIDVEVLSLLEGHPRRQEGHPDHEVSCGFFGPGGGNFEHIPEEDLGDDQDKKGPAANNTNPSDPSIENLDGPRK